MNENSYLKEKLKFLSLNKSRWKDFEKLLGEKGGCGGCWCMAWRLTPKIFRGQTGTKNKNAMKKLVGLKEQVGIIAYYENQPVGWCSFAPREKFIRLENSRVWKRIDDKAVWSISCFFVAKPFRRSGLSIELLKAVINFCKKKKVDIIEGYPVIPYDKNIPAAFAWTGIPSAFEKAGFVVAERRSKSKPIMRYYI